MENRIESIIILPQNKADFNEQLSDCINQIEEYFEKADSFIVQQSFFIDAPTNNDYVACYKTIYDELEPKLKEFPSTSVIAQPPADGYKISVELITISQLSHDMKLTYHEEQEIHYTVLTREKTKEVYAGGISINKPFNPFIDQVEKGFDLLLAILRREGMDYSDIARQWNYIEEILSIHDIDNEHIQNYQVLNDVRSRYYAQSEFKNSYPAATGIGMNSGGLVLEIYAITDNQHTEIIPIRNPKQVDAYSYSEEVLVGGTIKKVHKKTTPKFERAKYVRSENACTVYISGTASIQNEVSLGGNNIEHQTKITIDNIANLIAPSNLKNAGIKTNVESAEYSFIRVYIKNKNDVDKVRAICNAYFGNIPLHYLIADVCRANLLLEIEGVLSITS